MITYMSLTLGKKFRENYYLMKCLYHPHDRISTKRVNDNGSLHKIVFKHIQFSGIIILKKKIAI